MARRRMLDPDVWDDPDFQALPIAAQILFIAHVSLADDEGREQCDPRKWKAKVFPLQDTYTDENGEQRPLNVKEIRRLCDLLGAPRGAKPPMCTHYNGESGESLFQMSRWSRYQTIQHPRASNYPPPSGYVFDATSARSPKAGRKGKPATEQQLDLIKVMAQERGLIIGDFLEDHGYSESNLLAREITLIKQKLDKIPRAEEETPEYKILASQILRAWKGGEKSEVESLFSGVTMDMAGFNGLKVLLLRALGEHSAQQLTVSELSAKFLFNEYGGDDVARTEAQ